MKNIDPVFLKSIETSREPIIVFRGTKIQTHNDAFAGLLPKNPDMLEYFTEEVKELLDSKRKASSTNLEGYQSEKPENSIISVDHNRYDLKWYATIIAPTGASQQDPLVLIRVDLASTMQAEIDLFENIIHQQKYALDEAAIVAITDLKGVITYVNDKFADLSKYSKTELLGKTHSIVNSNFHEPEFFKNMWLTIGSGKVWRGEIRNLSKLGEHYWVDTTIVPTLDEHNRPISYVSIRYDITDKKDAHQTISSERARTAYAEKMASLGELAAGIAHELGNPLASINAWLDVLMSALQRGDFHTQAFLNTASGVKKKTDRMAKILKGMLSYARDGSNDPMSKVNISVLAKDVIDYTYHKLRKSGVMISMDAPDYATIDCRETEISQVLVNLILNSCDAVQDISERWVKLVISDQDQNVVISIIDSGAGIDEAIAQKILQPFFTTKTKGQGTGLGLSISSKIVEKHGGTIKIDKTSKNTKFDVTLPKSQQTSMD